MANLDLKVPESVPGAFFVDSSCIDCATCRHVAPRTFTEGAGHSYVQSQPEDESALAGAARALLCCPTNSIGSQGAEARAAITRAMLDFPQPITNEVRYCGFTSESSFGASSYFLAHQDGNWLIDSPRWLPQLAQRIAALGGISRIFLTHRDDVADAERYARHFSAQVIIHQGDQDAVSGPCQVLGGDEPIGLADGVVAIPVPGHTAGSTVLLVQDRYLFSGDHLWWNAQARRLGASQSACWFSWSQQRLSMSRLLNHRFSWVLPGHGDRIELSEDAMRRELQSLIGRMAEITDTSAE